MRTHTVLVLAAIAAAASTISCDRLKLGGSSAGVDAGASLGGPLAVLDGFEGEIDAFTKDNKPGAVQQPMSLFLKSNKVRFDVPESLKGGGAVAPGGSPWGDKGYVIYDGGAKKLWFVDDAKKEAIEIDLNSQGPKPFPGFSPPTPHRPGSPSGPSGPATTVTETGKYDTVAGYKCELWDVASDHKEGTLCVATQGLSWMSIPMTGIPTEQAWMLKLFDGNHFPLRYVAYQKDGTTEDRRIEVTKIDKKPLPDTQFQVPAGYKVIDLEKMFSSFGMPSGMPMPPHPPTPPHGH
ncbi:MAG TPA: DUF4412 domain-containing protein [Polyangiaceae bacterium]